MGRDINNYQLSIINYQLLITPYGDVILRDNQTGFSI